MAIRSRRRNAVLAPISRWLWWSPVRLFGSAALALVLVALVLSVFRHSPHHTSHRPTTPTSTPASLSSAPSVADQTALATDPPPGATPAPLTPTASSSIALPPAAANRALASSAATSWVRLWARPQLPAKQWLAELSPATFAYYLPTLASVNPANVPAARVAGPPALLRFAPGAADLQVPVAGGDIHAVKITMIWYPTTAAGHWVSSALEPVA